MTRAIAALAILTLALSSTALSQAPTTSVAHDVAAMESVTTPIEMPVEPEADHDEEPSRFQFGASVLAVADFISAGNGDEILDLPSYGGVGFDVHLGAAIVSGIGFNTVRFTLLAGYRGNAEYKWGFEALGISNDLFTHRHQGYIGFAGNRAELLIGGGAVFTHDIGFGMGHGGNLLAELRAGTRSGFTVSLGLNADFYANLYRATDGSKLRALNLFFGLGWKTL